ncbi:MAG: hypothetical protein CMN87_06675 [Stappia sp.]|uniref:hypothetical protein n=1 Tax=Stappia sp. TaxID=1870903 RepID=UPI000C67F191|nr:hypothetical protein [Stappia sp.]MAA97910.1 hypothetical protein [Stappia sp.]MBM19676.1 hypothetical protein [Stappia sp.]
MRLVLRCLPELLGHVPEPVPARASLPDWLRALPSMVESETLGGVELRGMKHCPPLVDALSLGVMFRLAADLEVDDGEIAWDWDPPIAADALETRSPVGAHAPEQARGAPFGLPPDQFLVKFTNFWTIEAPDGVSLLFTHPLNREDLPFRTLAGLVDCDRFRDGYVHFPAIWSDPGFSGVLPAGTPVAQAFPLRRDALELSCQAMEEADLARHREVQQVLQAEPGAYRKRFRAGLPKA